MRYEQLLAITADRGLFVYEIPFRSSAKALIKNNLIFINKDLETSVEKTCAIVEELAHFETSTGNILDQSNITYRKQEHKARAWAYQTLIPLQRIVEAGQAGVEGRYAIAEYLEVTEEFLQETISYYQRKHEIYTQYENYLIHWEPLFITKL